MVVAGVTRIIRPGSEYITGLAPLRLFSSLPLFLLSPSPSSVLLLPLFRPSSSSSSSSLLVPFFPSSLSLLLISGLPTQSPVFPPFSSTLPQNPACPPAPTLPHPLHRSVPPVLLDSLLDISGYFAVVLFCSGIVCSAGSTGPRYPPEEGNTDACTDDHIFYDQIGSALLSEWFYFDFCIAATGLRYSKRLLTRSPPSAWGALFSGLIPAQFVTFGYAPDLPRCLPSVCAHRLGRSYG